MTPTSRARWRKAAWQLGIVATLVGGIGLCEWAGWPFLKGPLERQASERLQRDVRFGDDFALRVLGSIRVKTDTLRIGPPQGGRAHPAFAGDLLTAGDAWLELPYATVRQAMERTDPSAPLHIRSLRLGRVDASLMRLADGRNNWSFGAPRTPAPQDQSELPRFDELVLSSGRVALRDELTKTTLDASVSTSEGDRATAAGEPKAGLVIDGRGRHEDKPFSFRITSAGALPLVARRDAARVPLGIRVEAPDARFAFDGTGTDVLALHALDGAAVLSGTSLAKVGGAIGVTLPTTSPFTLRGHLSKAAEVWTLKDAKLEAGDSRLGGQFRFDRGASVPVLSGDLTGARLVLADLLPAFGVARKAPANPKPPEGRVLPQRDFDIPSLKAMNAQVRVRVQRAELGTLFREPLAPLQGDLTLERGVLKLSNLLARTSGGELQGTLGLDSNPEQASWSADLRWAGVELDQWLRPRNTQARTKKPSGESPAYVTGKLGGHAELKARGNSTARLAGTIDGTVQAWVRDGTISHLVVEAAGIDAAQALGLLVVGDDQLPMHCAVVKANVKDGKLTPEAAIIDTRDSTLLVAGWVSLADEQLELTLTSRPKDVSPASLRAPVNVRGTFDQPKIELEKKPIALKLLGAAALAAVNPLAALIPLFDPGDKELADACAQTLRRLRDADGPPTVRDAKAPRPGEAKPMSGSGTRETAVPPSVRK